MYREFLMKAAFIWVLLFQEWTYGHLIRKEHRNWDRTEKCVTFEESEIATSTVTITLTTTATIGGQTPVPTPTLTTTTTTPTTSIGGQAPSPSPSNGGKSVSGTRATLTQFTDTQLQCGNYQLGEAVAAINPRLLGVTDDDWLKLYSNADPSNIPWCNKKLTLTINGVVYTYTIGDTCDPVGPTAQNPNAGGKCDYDDVIDLWYGQNFLKNIYRDDFYQGNVEWKIFM